MTFFERSRDRIRRQPARFALGSGVWWTGVACVLGLGLWSGALGCKPAKAQESVVVPLDTRQLVLVVSKDWQSARGELVRFVRENHSSPWKRVGESVSVQLGQQGLAWGIGLHPREIAAGQRRKREGDRRAPAGVFYLSQVLGIAPEDQSHGVRMPYRSLHKGLECIDDPESVHYNYIVDKHRVARPDWRSSEALLSYGALYRWIVVVEHNRAPEEAGAGSCIFMHVSQPDSGGTLGCTALGRLELEKLLGWLAPAQRPVLVQLPAASYRKVYKSWGLPLWTPSL